jgi:hypothetical protein
MHGKGEKRAGPTFVEELEGHRDDVTADLVELGFKPGDGHVGGGDVCDERKRA